MYRGLSDKLIIQFISARSPLEYYSIEYLKLKRPLNSKIRFQLNGMLYSAPKAASGIPILVPIATELDDAL